MRKILLMALIASMLITTKTLFVGCSSLQPRQEAYNDKDKSDFGNGTYIKFDFVSLKDVIDAETFAENNLNDNSYLYMYVTEEKSLTKTQNKNYYCGFLKNKNGAIYFLKIPTDKARIYKDAEYPCIIVFKNYNIIIDVNDENQWDDYDKFNLHLPENTVIPILNKDLNLLGGQ